MSLVWFKSQNKTMAIKIMSFESCQAKGIAAIRATQLFNNKDVDLVLLLSLLLQ